MTQRQSFPLVAVDFQGHEHILEHEGYTPNHAARSLAEDKGNGNFIKVFLDCSKIRHGRYAGGPPRKLVYCRKGYESHNTPPGVGAGLLAEKLSQASLECAEMLVKGWSKRGLRVVLEEEDDTMDVFITPKKDVTADDLRDLMDNKDSIIACIKQRDAAEQAANATQQPEPDETSEEDKVSYRDTVRRILPDLPKDFGISDVQKELRSWRHHDLAADRKCLHNVLHWVVKEGYAKRGARGRYILVDEKVFTRRSPPPPAPDAIAALNSPPPPPPQVVIPQVVRPAQPAQLRLVTVAPPPIPTIPPLSQDKPVQPVASSAATPPIQEALIRLATDLGAGSIDDSTIDQAQRAVNDMTNALAFFETLLQCARRNNTQKRQLMQAFAELHAPQN